MAQLVETEIEIDGNNIKQFSSLKISQGIFTHHSFRLVCPAEALDGTSGAILHSSRDIIGRLIKIQISAVGFSGVLKFIGVITQLDAERYSGHTGHIIISGFSPTIIMDNLPDFRSWENKNISDIANDVLQEFPKNLLHPTVNPVYTKKLDYKVQYKETSWQFLNRLCSHYGEWFFYDGETLRLELPKGKTTSLIYGNNLSTFTMSLQINPASHYMFTYDYLKPDTYDWNTDGVEKRAGLNELGKHTLKQSRDFFGVQPIQWATNSVIDKNQLDDILTTNAAMEGSKLVYFNGCGGHPAVRIGDIISVHGKNVFSLNDESFGDYTVINVDHHVDGQGNYQNNFVSIPAGIQVPPAMNFAEPVCETQPAIVTDNEDKNGMDQIRVQFPWQGAEKTPWISVLTSYAGKGRGLRFIPEVNDEVLISFIDNDPEKPYVLGAVHTEKSKSGYSYDKNGVKIIGSNTGRRIEIDEGEAIKITDFSGNSAGNIITLKNDNSSTTVDIVSGADDSNFSRIYMQKDSGLALMVKKGGDAILSIVFDSDKKDITINSKGTINISADGDLNLTGENVNIKGSKKINLNSGGSQDGEIVIFADKKIDIASSNELNVEGMASTVCGSTTLTLKSNASASLSAAIVKIN